MRQQLVEPRMREVEHLDELVGERALHEGRRVGVGPRPMHHVGEHLLILELPQARLAHPQQHPAAEQRLELANVEGARQ